MAEEQSGPRERPVLTGLVALVAVGLVVGLVLGGVALAATRVLGLDEGASTATATAGGGSLYLPEPSRTPEETGPAITLAPGGDGRGSSAPSQSATASEKPEKEITLSAAQTQVSSMEQIDLTGVYPGGEGAVLQVERKSPGEGWGEFDVTALVSNETFATYVQTGRTGPNKWRVRDTETGEVSNVVTVTVG